MFRCLSGKFCGGTSLPPSMSLEEFEIHLEGQDKAKLFHMIRMMLQWDPLLHGSARELTDREWLRDQFSCKALWAGSNQRARSGDAQYSRNCYKETNAP